MNSLYSKGFNATRTHAETPMSSAGSAQIPMPIETMNRFRISALAALAVLAGSLGAQSPQSTNAPAEPRPVSLDALVEEIRDRHPELAFYRAEVAAARAGVRGARQWENPELSVEVGSKRVWDRGRGATLGDGAVWSVALAQPFEWPGRVALRKAIANQQIEMAELGLAQFQAALANRARTLGRSVVAAQEQADATDEVAERFQALLAVLVQRDPAGVTPVLDQRIIEAHAITLSRQAAEARRAVQASLIEINQLRGLPAATPLAIEGALTVATNLPPLSLLLDVAATNNFDIRLRQAELAQQGFQVQLARNERYPRVTLAPFYAAEKANDEQRIVGLGVSLPLPLWHQNRAGVEVAAARQQQAEASLRTICLEVERQVTGHALALETRLKEMARWRSDAPRQLREAAILADEHYRLGAVPVTTYLEMQTRYLEALEAVLATRAEAIEHRQQLELLLGVALDSLPAR